MARRIAGSAARSIALTAVFSGAALAQPGALQSSGGPGQPALWRVSDADSVLWVFGSVHALPEAFDWRRPDLLRALIQADRVYFEFTAAPEALGARLQEIGFNPPGVLLSDSLNAASKQRLSAALRRLDLPPAAVEPLRPWLANWRLSARFAERSGLFPEYGVDHVLRDAALAAGKDVRALDDLEATLRYLSNYTPEEQLALLEETLRQIEEEPNMLRSIVEAWRSGDQNALAAAMEQTIAGTPPAFFNQVFVDRNRAWADELGSFMQGSGEALVVVGAGHLVGEDNLLQLLTARGYVIERR